MRLPSILRLRLRTLLRRRDVEQELDDEIRYHVDRQIEQEMASGVSRAEARRLALASIAGMEQRKEECRDMRGLNLLDNVGRDLSFASRQLAKYPAFTITAVLVLSLGMCASVAIFSFVDAALIKPLPYKDAKNLVGLFESVPEIAKSELSYPDYLDWKKLNTVFSSMEIYQRRNVLVRAASGAEPAGGARVSDRFFHTLGVAPGLGRDFHTGEDSSAAPRTVMLSYSAWQKRYGGTSDVLGRVVTLNEASHVIVGVLPRDFHFAPAGNAEFWVPFQASGRCDLARSCHSIYGVGRLKGGVTLEVAAANIQSIAKALEKQYPDTNRDQGAVVVPLQEVIVGDIRPILYVLFGGAILLLLIATINVAGLLLVRSDGRTREIAVRNALGASTTRLFSQFATESLVLVGLGSTIGVISAACAMQLLVKLIPAKMLTSLPFLQGLGFNPRVLAFAAVISLFAVALFSLAPILRLPSSNTRVALAEGGRGSAGITWRRLGSKLVVLELTTAMVLLVGAGLLGKSLYLLLQVNLGFSPDRVATLEVVAPQSQYANDGRKIALARELVNRISALPGVQSVGLGSRLPVAGNGNTTWIRIPGRAYKGEHHTANQREVSSGYFTTLNAKLLRGRYFEDREDTSKPRVVIINQEFARQHFAKQDPLGKQIGDKALSPNSLAEIVGIVEDIREGGLDSEIWPAVYYHINQSPDTYFSVVVRSARDEQGIAPMAAAAIRQIDPRIVTITREGMRQRINETESAYLRRSSAWLVGSFAAVAFLLSIVGLYGVVAYSVSQRTREIGVRVALGAEPASVCRLVMKEAVLLAMLGTALGVVCSLASASLIRKLLFSVEPWDAPTLLAVATVLAISALLASYLPARRAASVNPVEALRVG